MQTNALFEKIIYTILKRVITQTDVLWTADKLPAPRNVLDGLVEEGLLYCINGAYTATELGIDVKSGIDQNPSIDFMADTMRFKDEALTGLRSVKSKKSGFIVSEQSSINNAVLVKPHKRSKYNANIDLKTLSEAKKILVEQLGVSSKQLETYQKEGRIRVCKHCGKVGVFNKNKQYYQSKCRECQKALAKKTKKC